MRITKLLLKIVVALVVIILIAEITLRVTIPNELQKRTEVQYQPDSVLGYRYKANSTGVVIHSAFSRPYKINSQGFAGPEFNAKKATGVYRIAVIGASEETGLFTDGPFSYATITGDMFKQNGYNVEVINLSVDGHGRSVRNVEFVKRECALYEPDLILFRDLEFPLEDYMQYRDNYKGILIKYTDTSSSNVEAAKAYIDNEILHKDWRLYLFDYSYIYRYFVKNYLHVYQKSKFWERVGRPFFESPNKMEGYARHLIFWPYFEYTPRTFTENESKQIYIDLQAALSKRNTRLIIYHPYKITDAPSVIQYFAKDHITYLPLEVPFQNKFTFGKLDGHPSQLGHKAIGEALFNALKDSIPASYKIAGK